jgi:hypothetical protein
MIAHNYDVGKLLDVIQERLVQNCQFYQVKGSVQGGKKEGEFEEELRKITFEAKIPFNQYDMLLKCLSRDMVIKAKKLYQQRKETLSKMKVPLLLAYCN